MKQRLTLLFTLCSARRTWDPFQNLSCYRTQREVQKTASCASHVGSRSDCFVGWVYSWWCRVYKQYEALWLRGREKPVCRISSLASFVLTWPWYQARDTRDLFSRSLRSLGLQLMYYKGQDRGNTKEQYIMKVKVHRNTKESVCLLLATETVEVSNRDFL
jgi:hypothetical protein